MEDLKLHPIITTIIIVLLILLAALVGLYIAGRRHQDRQSEQQAAIEANKQVVSMLIIDKKRLRIKESGLPKIVHEQMPVYLRWTKLPIVKAKVGPKVMTLMADDKVFNILPTKAEVKAVVSGIYITEIKSVRGGTLTPPKKKGFFKNLFKK